MLPDLEITTSSKELALFLCHEMQWSELPVEDLAEDILLYPWLYYPEYVYYCRHRQYTPVSRAEWPLMVVSCA